MKKTNKEYEEKILAEQEKARAAEKVTKDAELALADKLREKEAAVRKTVVEENILKDQKHKEELLGKDKTISDMAKKLEEAQNTGALGSQQLQVEAKEISLKDILGDAFPQDELSDVPTGTPGGDVIQKVLGPTGEPCGTILWESKNVKNWSKAWITKLKGDQLEAKAEIAILYTSVMPKDVTDHYACIDGVHVVNRLTLQPVATTLRSGLIEITRTKVSEEGRDMKHVMLYNYRTSSEFAQRIGMMLTTYTEEREQLAVNCKTRRKDFGL